MSREPRTSDDRKAHALAMREQARDVTRAAIARHRVVSMLMAFLGPLGGIAFSAWLLTEVASDDQLMALLPAVIGVGLGSGGAWMVGVCRPLPTHLLATGVATPAAILEVTTIGPTIELAGGSAMGSLARQRYCIQVRPEGREPYEVMVKTFDGPVLLGLGQPPLTVYVDPRDARRICPDWSTLPSGA
jgi:hypothetical protein